MRGRVYCIQCKIVFDDNVDSSCSPSFLLELLDGSHYLAVQSI